MLNKGIVPVSVDSIRWQDYRGAESGMIVYYTTDPVSEFPIREIPEELPSDISPEPNYETGTFGFYGCKHSKIRSAFNKKKLRYLFFMTKYAGTKVDFMEELMVTGFFRIKQTADVKRLHIRYLEEYSCIDEDNCIALRAEKVHFVAAEDGFIITDEVLKSWGVTSRVTKQTKIILDEEKTAALLTHLESKKNIVEAYSEETERLLPAFEEDYDEEEGDELEDADESTEVATEEEDVGDLIEKEKITEDVGLKDEEENYFQ